MTHYTIAFTSDTICPWCYIASRRLSRAIGIHTKTVSSADTFAITWLPYYLDQPNVPLGTSVTMADRIVAKNGVEMGSGIKSRLTRTGLQEGIVFDFQGRLGDTGLSHRLIDYAGRGRGERGNGVDGMQSMVAQEIFRRVFEAGGDVTDMEMLVDVAVTSAGMDEAKVREYLAGEGGREKVDGEAREAREEKGVKGVPYVEVVVDGRRKMVDGAVDIGEWLEVFGSLRGDGVAGEDTLVARGA